MLPLVVLLKIDKEKFLTLLLVLYFSNWKISRFLALNLIPYYCERLNVFNVVTVQSFLNKNFLVLLFSSG